MPLHDFSNFEMPYKVYDFTVQTDQATIDTNVDGPAGLFPTGGSCLEIYIVCRTDEAVVKSVFNCKFNNDGGSNYEYSFVDNTTSTVTGGGTSGVTVFQLLAAGASAAANEASVWKFEIPNYSGTTFNKPMIVTGGIISGANRTVDFYVHNYVSTSAVTRFAMTPNTAGKKWKAGTRVCAYIRV